MVWVENKTEEVIKEIYEDYKQDYMKINLYRVADLKKKYNIPQNIHKQLVKRIEEETGFKRDSHIKNFYHPSNYCYYNRYTGRYAVYRWIKGKLVWKGAYSTEEEARMKVKELGWVKE